MSSDIFTYFIIPQRSARLYWRDTEL